MAPLGMLSVTRGLRGAAVAAFTFVCAGVLTTEVACVNVDALGAGGPRNPDGGVFIDASGVDASSTPDAGDAGACPGTGGPPGVRAGAFCIDATEVTNAQYAAFLDAVAAGATAAQPAHCSWNTVLAPATGGSCSGLFDPVGRASHPVVCVDWCDADAFCRWAGKRLCTGEEWLRACTQGGAKAYPYGNTFDPNACNGGASSATGLRPVGSMPSCEGGFPGVFDLSGNAVETIADCDEQSGPDDRCYFRGGRFSDDQSDLACAPDHVDTRDNTNASHTFRCCSP